MHGARNLVGDHKEGGKNIDFVINTLKNKSNIKFLAKVFGECKDAPDLEQIFFAGIPVGNETVWFHRASGTLILTDLCQWWQGDLSFPAKLYASLTGVRKQLAVPKTIRWMTKDKPAARDCANKILTWPIERIVVAHNAIIEKNARASLQQALSWFEQ